MEDTTIPTPEGPLPPVVVVIKPVKVRAEQDTRIENHITETAQTLALIQASPKLIAFAASKGFGAARLAEGAALVAAAQSAYAGRQLAIGSQETAGEALARSYRLAYEATVEFRETVRIHFPAQGARQALATTGNIPRDADNFLTRARAGIEAAKKATYATTLARAGYDQAGLSAYAGVLDGFALAKTTYESAVSTAVDTTTNRDTAYIGLRAFSVPLARLLRLAQRKGIR